VNTNKIYTRVFCLD